MMTTTQVTVRGLRDSISAAGQQFLADGRSGVLHVGTLHVKIQRTVE
jgi:hypothetical protein